MTVREPHARLLADSRSAEPRTRLSQAVSRADFLLRISRAVSAVQHPARVLESLAALLVDNLVDAAQAVVRTGPLQLTGSAVHGEEPRFSERRWADLTSTHVQRVLDRGIREDILLPGSTSERRSLLDEVIDDPDLAERIDLLGSHQVVVLPLIARGRCFGALTLVRAGGYGFTGADGFLDDLADRIAVGLDASLVVAESRRVASVLRRSLAPTELPHLDGIDLASFYRVAFAAEDVGGDLLDVHGKAEDFLVVCGDVSGKGVEAAVDAKRIRNAVRTSSHVARDPAWILGLVNRVLIDEADGFSERLATVACARFRPEGGGLRVDLASAGHPPAYVLRADGRVEEVGVEGAALALLEEAAYDAVTLRLEDRDLLLLYTDGVTEARGSDGELFGDDRLRRHLRGLTGLPATAVVESLAVAVSDHLGDNAHDDIAILAVGCRPR